eukprot:TRINITY_DN4679_c0_g1_i1.p1 TRINITY_DN4679_c0_g1~~TRINITY_DN4679_c0_g1_i1.p1  ORF type:complete len:193 (-),score=45.28 TRINITY_DN4679_c0_g1_i1:79-657(-)
MCIRDRRDVVQCEHQCHSPEQHPSTVLSLQRLVSRSRHCALHMVRAAQGRIWSTALHRVLQNWTQRVSEYTQLALCANNVALEGQILDAQLLTAVANVEVAKLCVVHKTGDDEALEEKLRQEALNVAALLEKQELRYTMAQLVEMSADQISQRHCTLRVNGEQLVAAMMQELALEREILQLEMLQNSQRERI